MTTITTTNSIPTTTLLDIPEVIFYEILSFLAARFNEREKVTFANDFKVIQKGYSSWKNLLRTTKAFQSLQKEATYYFLKYEYSEKFVKDFIFRSYITQIAPSSKQISLNLIYVSSKCFKELAFKTSINLIYRLEFYDYNETKYGDLSNYFHSIPNLTLVTAVFNKDCFGCCQQTTFLILDRCTGIFPVIRFPALVYLTLIYTAVDLSSLSHLKGLKVIDQGEPIKGLEKLKNLEQLILIGTKPVKWNKIPTSLTFLEYGFTDSSFFTTDLTKCFRNLQKLFIEQHDCVESIDFTSFNVAFLPCLTYLTLQNISCLKTIEIDIPLMKLEIINYQHNIKVLAPCRRIILFNATQKAFEFYLPLQLASLKPSINIKGNVNLHFE